MLAQRRRRWAKIKPTLVLTGIVKMIFLCYISKTNGRKYNFLNKYFSDSFITLYKSTTNNINWNEYEFLLFFFIKIMFYPIK